MATNICEIIEADDFYKEFLKSDEPGDTASVETILSINEKISKLSEGVELVSTQLQAQVRQQHSSLLLEASNASKLTSAINTVNNHMNQVETGAKSLKTQINVPYELLANQTRALTRLHDVSHLLRQSGRFLQLSRKLAAEKEIAAQASILFELELLMDDENLCKIDFIREERISALNLKKNITSLAHHDLLNALKDAKEVDERNVINSLQIFTNLQALPNYIDDLLEIMTLDLKELIKQCFLGNDISKLGLKDSKPLNHDGKSGRAPGKAPHLATTKHFATKFWNALEWLFNKEICNYWFQIQFLAKCLKRVVRGPNTSNFDHQKIDVESRFLADLNVLLRDSFGNAPAHIKQCLKQDFPKLLQLTKLFNLKSGTKFSLSESLFESLESGYLEQCAINIKQPLNGPDVPNQEAVESFIQAAEKEIKSASIDNRLCQSVANIFIACNKDFWGKVEANIKFGGDSAQVFDVPNPSQLQNIALANSIYDHNELVKRMIINLEPTFVNTVSASNILESLNHGSNIVLRVVKQLTHSMKSAANIILLSIHREPGLNSDRTLPMGSSLYMKELQEFLHRAWNCHILPFKDKQIVEGCGKELADSCVELLMWNIAIIRPISSSGRQRIKNDCQHLESTLSPLIGDITAIGRTFRLLRSMSSLISMPPDELSKQSIEIDGLISPVIILLLLFGYAGVDLASPHVSAGWTNDKIIEWLSSHVSTRDRLELITGALQKYRKFIRQENVVQYDPIYPLISNYLENVNKFLASKTE